MTIRYTLFNLKYNLLKNSGVDGRTVVDIRGGGDGF